MRTSLPALVGCSLLVVLATAALVGAAPPPLAVCSVCDGLDGATDGGTLDIHVDENGDSEWIARVPVDGNAADAYRSDPAALDAAVEDGWRRYDTVGDDRDDVDASISERTVVVRYAVDDVATAGVGDGWVFDYLYAGGTNQRYELAADRVTIHLPDGYQAANEPPNAVAEDGTVTWIASDARGGTGAPVQKTYVTYGRSDVVGTLESWGSGSVVFGPLVLEHTVRAGIAPVALLGIATVAASTARTGRLLVPLGGPGRSAIERGVDRLGGTVGRRTLVGIAAGTAGALGGLGWLLSGPALALLAASFGLAAALFLPLGYALECGESAWQFGAIAVIAPLVPVAAFSPYYVFGFDPLFAGVLFVPWGVGAGAVGYLCSQIGRQTAVVRRAEPN
ncbi:hypothetical protein [Halosolutus gelatinilyticus]|uniref:hypothetical protein n=1 Tax=Halosolutus gelatinilyticus TaxID=2931975 RepID=UPI001FF622E7|nr:hypothetical protein [Halosolutus gelatinilyticus]